MAIGEGRSILFPLIKRQFYLFLRSSSRRGFLQEVEQYRMFYNCIQRSGDHYGDQQRQTPWLIAQMDNPDMRVIEVIQALTVIDLEHILKQSGEDA